ncbi:MAG TPA: class I SAM-dependent methyltransferase [Opitutaceae bacterium]|jgi:SAM-dependent methyltransferase
MKPAKAAPSRAKTREPQYQRCVELADERVAELGLMTNQIWRDDPRRLGFVLARYKFAAKMLRGMDSVLEVGCGDAFGTRVVRQEVGRVTAVDFDPVFVADVNRRMDPAWPFECRVHDLLDGPVPGPFDGAYAIDVIEHVRAADADRFVRNIGASLRPGGVCLIGTPSLESQAHASEQSRAGHVNCMSEPQLRELMKRHFANVFIFSMNDEVVHTGRFDMANYLAALCCVPR